MHRMQQSLIMSHTHSSSTHQLHDLIQRCIRSQRDQHRCCPPAAHHRFAQPAPATTPPSNNHRHLAFIAISPCSSPSPLLSSPPPLHPFPPSPIPPFPPSSPAHNPRFSCHVLNELWWPNPPPVTASNIAIKWSTLPGASTNSTIRSAPKWCLPVHNDNCSVNAQLMQPYFAPPGSPSNAMRRSVNAIYMRHHLSLPLPLSRLSCFSCYCHCFLFHCHH
ncbi:unnamed protein product [Taenia asiatica]|uniref:Uncharacterized protein n=1 Tax=Taenia asiatica TaxID=60517 RepID=A0A0R3WGS3_TAEAS|nr:unnamed protein product [Taenia asiatica]